MAQYVRPRHRAAVALAMLLTQALLLSVMAASAEATPNMIRLGYPTCASCHLSPQGGGLLTEYGKGIDLAQSLRPEELKSSENPDDYRRLPYDMKFSFG